MSLLIGTLVFAQDAIVDVNKSTLVWTGKKVTGQHTGTISIKNGALTLKNGNIQKGAFARLYIFQRKVKLLVF